MLPWKKNKSDDNIEQVESYLDDAMHPVSARRDFVSGLYTTLLTGPVMYEPAQAWRDSGRLSGLLLGGIGIITGAVLVIAGLRLIQQNRQQKSQ